MKVKEIQVGETYFFVATDSPARKHLEGTEFTVFEIKPVWRRFSKKSKRVVRFFNEFGEGARPEELEPLAGILEIGHPANIQPSDYRDNDDLPF